MKAAILFLSLMVFSACNGAEQKATVDKPQNEPDEQQPVITAIDNNDFSIKCESAGETGDEDVPKVNLLLTSEKIKPSILIATEPGCTELRDRPAFNMPNDAAFTTNGYYAGGGNYYYGYVKNDTLNIYRQYIEETHPDNDVNPAETTYDLYKTVVVMDDGTTSVETQNDKK